MLAPAPVVINPVALIKIGAPLAVVVMFTAPFKAMFPPYILRLSLAEIAIEELMSAAFCVDPLLPAFPNWNEAGAIVNDQSLSMLVTASKLWFGEVMAISPVTLKANLESSVILLVRSFSPPAVVKVEPWMLLVPL
ncbi:unannotated protein [freshwater metagenome]|uniref:Unannotated protein n=1 Tax=freshwater metagenome TaxID=449393 RepID=A0A6J6JQB2_9ZZZZ